MAKMLVEPQYALSPVPRQGLTADQVELIKKTIAKDCTDDELRLFINQCNRTGLDPFSRQIYAIKRWDKKVGAKVLTIQTSIDGLRLIASRTGEYDGQDAAQWCGPDGAWDEIWLDDKKPPFAAKISVYRKNISRAFVGIAKFVAYVGQDKEGNTTAFWSRMPDHMLAKVAEALAIRKAFPMETSGIYIREEMSGTDSVEIEESGNGPTEGRPEPITTFRKQLESAAPNGGQAEEQEGKAGHSAEAAVAPAVVKETASTAGAPKPKINYITDGQARNLHRDFRAEVKKYNAKAYMQADQHFYEGLLTLGFFEAVTEDGEEKKIPSASLIPAQQWFPVKKQMLEIARSAK